MLFQKTRCQQTTGQSNEGKLSSLSRSKLAANSICNRARGRHRKEVGENQRHVADSGCPNPRLQEKRIETKWLSSNTKGLIIERSQLKVTRKDDQQQRKHYNCICRQIKRSAKSDKEQYVNKICEDIESMRKENNSRAVYVSIRKITGTRVPKVNIVKDKTGVTLEGDVEVKSRWKEYFEELYNDPNTVYRNVLSELQKSTEEENEPGILLDEGRTATAKMKKNKSPLNRNR